MKLRHLAALGSTIAWAACASHRPSPPPLTSAVLVTVDTMRGDCFGAAGDPELRTPYLDRLFRQGAQFASAFSACPMTLPSHTSILSGAWPTTHGVSRNGVRVPDRVRTLAEILKEQGFATAAFVSSVALDPTYHLDQGFDVYNFRPVVGKSVEDAWRPAPRTVHRAVTWWTSTPGRKFLWVHVFEPHFPYEPPAPFSSLYETGYHGRWSGSSEDIMALWADPKRATDRDVAHITSLYRGEITTVDRGLGILLREVEDDPKVAVVLTADHGESLGEHGLLFKHGPFTYPGDVRVPLVVRGGPFERSVSLAVVRSIDIAQTVLSLLGVRAELPPEAKTLAPWIHGGAGLVSYGVASIGRYRPGTSPWDEVLATEFSSPDLMRVARTDHAACVEAPWEDRLEWFDRTVDPGELHPLPFPGTAEAESLRSGLDRWIGSGVASAEPVADARLKEALKSLGYVNEGR
ncbi:MAG: sulfatase [bacterium]